MALIGVVAALLISNKPVGFVAILGILALLGMIARNAVILIDQIENERAEGKAVWHAVIAGAMSRFRPIMLTAISTVLGLIPIAPTIFWGPMAYAIMGGLLVATALTLIFLPALYVVWFRAKVQRRRFFPNRTSTCANCRRSVTDCAECETKSGRIDRIERIISLEGDLNAEQRAQLMEIADKCPVHHTLKSEIDIRTMEELRMPLLARLKIGLASSQQLERATVIDERRPSARRVHHSLMRPCAPA